jgi:hypothetical protein
MTVKPTITFLTKANRDEAKKISLFVEHANKMIKDYFGIVTEFDILICHGSWEMEVQIISRAKELLQRSIYGRTKFAGITDYTLKEIVIRYDIAKFGHYLHELIHGIISKSLTHQLREGLAWYFTLKLTETHKYVRPSCPLGVNEMYIVPTHRLAEIVGEEFLKDLAVGKASLDYELLPKEIQGLFLSEEIFYAENRCEK